MSNCPCGLERPFEECCGPIINGAPAPTAEALMRSRYSAHVTGAYEYLDTSIHPDMRGEVTAEEIKEWSSQMEWTGLEVESVKAGREEDETGEVTFVAHYSLGGVPQILREQAFFRKVEGNWFYVEGMVEGQGTYRRETPKVGRNELCPCGSGKKFKKCCMNK